MQDKAWCDNADKRRFILIRAKVRWPLRRLVRMDRIVVVELHLLAGHLGS